jgi:formiminoglutamase
MKILPFDPKTIAGSASLDDSRLGLHACGINISELKILEHGIVIVGFADDTGIRNVGGRAGAKDGPAAARGRLYKFTTGAPSFPLYDLGDVLPEKTILSTHETCTSVVRAIREAGHFPIVLGGGHDLGFPHALGVLEHSQAKTRFCNIDAHLDVRPVTNGITSGSPWYLLREHPAFAKTGSRIEEFGIQSHCNAHSLVAYAQKHGFGMTWLDEIRSKKKSAADQFTAILGGNGGKERMLVSLDIDCVQISDAPGCSAPQTLGFSPTEVIQMSFFSGAHARVDSFGIFELSPPLDSEGKTTLLVAHCINACLRGYATRLKVRRTNFRSKSR